MCRLVVITLPVSRAAEFVEFGDNASSWRHRDRIPDRSYNVQVMLLAFQRQQARVRELAALPVGDRPQKVQIVLTVPEIQTYRILAAAFRDSRVSDEGPQPDGSYGGIAREEERRWYGTGGDDVRQAIDAATVRADLACGGAGVLPW